VVDSAASEEARLWQWVAEHAERYRASFGERPVAARANSEAVARKLSELEPLRLPAAVSPTGRAACESRSSRELEQCAGPVVVCAQAGNVNSGAFDPLDQVAACVSRQRERRGIDSVWLHVGVVQIDAKAGTEPGGLDDEHRARPASRRHLLRHAQLLAR
jgi:hypothetical protein